MTNSLIIAPQWIGDAVMTEPLLRALSERGEKITVFAVSWVAPIYRAMNHITGLQATVDVPFQHGGLQWQARRGLAARIHSGEWGKFDRAYVLPNSLKSALLPWLANIPERIGYLGEMRYGLLNKRLANPPRDARSLLRLCSDDAMALRNHSYDCCAKTCKYVSFGHFAASQDSQCQHHFEQRESVRESAAAD